jgi:hypothetical protein
VSDAQAASDTLTSAQRMMNFERSAKISKYAPRKLQVNFYENGKWSPIGRFTGIGIMRLRALQQGPKFCPKQVLVVTTRG